MANKQSAGLVLYRIRGGTLELLLVHLGGPAWTKKDAGAWFIPKGEIEGDENPLAAAQREFREETGFEAKGPFLELGSARNKSGKTILAWAFAGDCDPAKLRSNSFCMEWPPKSGRRQEFPEVDRGAFFTIEEARGKAHPAELALLEKLDALLRDKGTLASGR
jgi:predicted NUDIX family NTP pyrophosphohydrolase